MTDFKDIGLADKAVFDRFFAENPPQISELTFTNLFMWRHRNHPAWRVHDDFLFIVLRPEEEPGFALPPVGKGNVRAALDALADGLESLKMEPRISRADKAFVEAHVDRKRFEIVADRANHDYVYVTRELIELSGNKFHQKKNHLNRFIKNYEYEYRKLDLDLVDCFLNLQEVWCELKDCEQTPGLFYENRAICLALTNCEELGFEGGAILIDKKVEAFALGEKLNPDTAVIHVEKANPDIPGLYAAINQQFCSEHWSSIKYINREQDLGVEGLRKAKKSYHPHHMVEKFTLIRKS
ncbi:MAG: phosphatidylglycerol lysyltransferase domain-containing protein [Thermodesulfobacteriota bacterium]